MDEDMAKQQIVVTEEGSGPIELPPDAQLPTQALRYVGDGEYIYGVPARDLTADEAASFAALIAATQAATERVLYAYREE